jgi:high-affinity iron transporter
MLNATFIVWREAVEAILIVGILYAWLAGDAQRSRALRWLWGGVASGLLLAGFLGAAILLVQSELSGVALEAFQAVMLLLAAALITQMVIWMQRHGRALKADLQQHATRAIEQSRWWGVASLATIAVGREGAETVMFLYGITLEHGGAELASWLTAAGGGLAAAAVTAWLLTRGGRLLPARTFFRLSGAVLLLLAASLLVGGVEKLIALDWLPALAEPLWDTSAVLDVQGTAGGLLAAFAGYRAQPSLTLVLAYGLYWVAVTALLSAYASRPARRVQPA